jgi:hypothetical protein
LTYVNTLSPFSMMWLPNVPLRQLHQPRIDAAYPMLAVT